MATYVKRATYRVALATDPDAAPLHIVEGIDTQAAARAAALAQTHRDAGQEITVTRTRIKYQARVRMKGHAPRSATFDRLTDAKKWAATIEAAITEGRHFKTVEAKRRTLGELIDRYVRHVLPSKKDKTQAPQLGQLGYWKKALGHLTLAHVTPAILAEQRERLKDTPIASRAAPLDPDQAPAPAKARRRPGHVATLAPTTPATGPGLATVHPIGDAAALAPARPATGPDASQTPASPATRPATGPDAPQAPTGPATGPDASQAPASPPRYRTPATVNRYLAALSHVFTYAVKELNWMDENPLTKVSKEKEPSGRTRFLSEAERDAFLDACRVSTSPDLYPAVVLALSTGARRQEIIGLSWREVDLKRGRVTLPDTRTKNGEPRVLPLTHHALALLRERVKVRRIDTDLIFPARDRYRRLRAATAPLPPADLRTPFETALKRSGITGFRWHDLRHTAASYLAMNGATLAEIAEILGHKTLAMVKRYSHLSEAHTAGVVEKMNRAMFGDRA